MADEILEGEFYTLTDEDGNESRFELVGSVPALLFKAVFKELSVTSV